MEKECQLGISGIAVENNPKKDYYLHNYKITSWVVFKVYQNIFADRHCGSGKTFKRRRYCFGTFLWNLICGWGLKEAWKSYKKLINH